MIKSDKGEFTIEGNVSSVYADLGVAIIGVIEAFVEHGYPRDEAINEIHELIDILVMHYEDGV